MRPGTNIEAADSLYRTLLSHAVARDYVAIVQLLLDKGANAVAVNTFGRWRPLLCAKAWEHGAMERLL